MFNEKMTVKKPEKTKIQARNGIKYVYYVKEQIYHKEKQYVTEKRVLIGKMIDDEKMNPNNNYFTYYSGSDVTFANKGFAKANSVHVGASLAFKKIAKELDLENMLDKYFPTDDDNSDYHQKIIDIASSYLITESCVGQNFDTFWNEHYTLSNSMKDDSAISKFYKTLKVSKNGPLFYKNWIDKNIKNERIFVSYDSTNIPNYSEVGVELAEFGKAKIHDEAKQINIGYAINQISGVPLMSEIYNGSINDIERFKYLIKKLKDYGINGVNFVLDRGYFSKENINSIYNIGSGFLMCAKISNVVVAKYIEENQVKIQDPNNYIPNQKIYGITIFDKMFKDDLKGEEKYFHIYFDPVRFINEKEKFLNSLHNFLGKVINNPAILNDENNLKLSSFINKKVDEKGEIKFEINSDETAKATKFFGYFCLISSMKLTATEAINFYENRDVVEKLFLSLKNHLGCDKFGVHSDASIQSKGFVTFIAAIIRNQIYFKCKKLKEQNNKEYTVPQIIKQLDSICLVRGASETYNLFDGPTSKQKKILSAIGLTISDIVNAGKELSED